MTLLQARSLTVSLGPTPVIRDVSLSLSSGRVLGLVGESGAGKTMIGRAIAQLLPPGFVVAGGSLQFDGQDLVAMPQARRRALLGREIVFIPQEPLTALNPVLTIGAQLDEHLAHLGIPRRARRERALAALEEVHLPDAAALLVRYPHQLSGGMCQRVLIAMAFAGEPKLVVADEPTTALDVTIQARIMALMAELQRAHNTAVLFITHDLRLASQICDEIAVLYAGAVAERGPAREVFAAARHPYTRCLQLANPPMTGPRRVLFALPEQMPGPRALAAATGCRFAPRCPVAEPRCHEEEPPLAGAEHQASCYFPERTASLRPGTAPATRPRSRPGALVEVEELTKRFRTGGVFSRRETLAVR
ncbi:MAG TPA: ABC transporter ATP-binding protein, partial [Acetobacteraceae bacterium]